MQTTMKIDRKLLKELRALAGVTHRSPQKYIKHMVEQEMSKLTPSQRARLKTTQETEASEALEGYKPLSETGGRAYELQQQWITGEITNEERIKLLKKHHGVK